MDTEKTSDRGYKALFSHPKMVEDLLRSFVHEDFLSELDFTTLRKTSQTFITGDLRQREADIVWELHIKGEPAYIYLLLEFQSTVERFMAVRMLSYICLLYLDLLKKQTPRRLPPVFPLVLYNGHETWTAPQQISDLIEVPQASLRKYVPGFRYFLVSENTFSRASLIELENLVSGMFLVETSGLDRMADTIERVRAVLDREAGPALRRDFTAWVRRILERDGINFDPFTINPSEVRKMLEATRRQEREGWYGEGIEQGIEQGITRGLRESIKLVLESRFGEPSLALHGWLDSVTEPDRLRAILLRVGRAQSINEVLDDLTDVESRDG